MTSRFAPGVQGALSGRDRECGGWPLLVAVALVILNSVLVVSPAGACLCRGHSAWGFLAPADGRLPANAVGVAWYRPPSSKSFTLVLAQVSVEMRAEDGTFDQVPAVVEAVDGFPGVFVIGPRDGFRPGATYRFSDRGERRRTAPERVTVTVDDAPLEAVTPLSLSIWPLYSETISVSVRSGTCQAPLWVAQVLTEVALPEPFQEWRDQLLYRTFVDGRVWRPKSGLCDHIPPGRSWRETTAEDLLFSECSDPTGRTPKYPFYQENVRHQGLDATDHEVRVQAFLPGTDVVLESEAVSADLSCPGHLEP